MKQNIITLSIFGIAAFIVLLIVSQRMDLNLEDSSVVTGYVLIAVMLCVALFNTRKKLTMIPLGKASSWLVFHLVGGVFCIALFWLHTKTIWPKGIYEGFLAGTFYLVSISGILGYLIQRGNSRKLTETGVEVIYERIPLEIKEIRDKAQEHVLECTEKTGSDTLANHYMDTLAWYFQKPRFYWATLFGSLTPLGVGMPRTWLRNKGDPVKRYLTADELAFFERVEKLAELKILIDRHYVYQDLNKKWLLFHVPLSTGLVIMALWHLLLVEVYGI